MVLKTYAETGLLQSKSATTSSPVSTLVAFLSTSALSALGKYFSQV